MKNALLLILVLAFSPSTAQVQSLFHILTVYGDVTLDDQPVKPGQHVYPDSKKLRVIGKESYANILTANGYAEKLTTGNYTPAKVNEDAADHQRPRPRSTAAIVETPPISVLTLPDRSAAAVFGDSIFLLWKVNYKRMQPPFTISLQTMFADPLYDTTLQLSYCLLPVGSFFVQENAIVVRISTGKDYAEHVAKKIDEELRKKTELDLQSLTSQNLEGVLERIAIFEIHQLLYDVTYQLYKIRITEKSSGVPVTNSYYQRLLVKYGMDKL